MFEQVREKVLYPSAKDYQKSDEDVVDLGWAGAYLSDLAAVFPQAKVVGWRSLRVVGEVTLKPAEILEEKLNYIKSMLSSSDDPVVKEVLSRI